MKPRPLWVVLVLASLLIGAAPIRTVRLTVINKSGLPVEISLIGNELEKSYYLRVPKGDKTTPAESHIELVPDTYAMKIYYVELWDPVYGYDCTAGGKTVEITHTARLTFLGCSYTPPSRGEPSMWKYPEGARSVNVRRR